MFLRDKVVHAFDVLDLREGLEGLDEFYYSGVGDFAGRDVDFCDFYLVRDELGGLGEDNHALVTDEVFTEIERAKGLAEENVLEAGHAFGGDLVEGYVKFLEGLFDLARLSGEQLSNVSEAFISDTIAFDVQTSKSRFQ